MSDRDTDGDENTGPQRLPDHNAPAVLCGRCEHLNPVGNEQCIECGEDLYVECSACGSKNQRVHVRCSKCHKRLRGKLLGGKRSKRRRHSHKSSGSSSRTKTIGLIVLQTILVLLGLGLALGLLYLLNNLG